MHSKCLLPIAALALVLAGAGCNKSGKLDEPSTFTPPTGPVELKLKWPTGQRVVQDMDMKMKTETDVPGQPQPIKQDIAMGQKYLMTVLKETADGGHEVEMEFLSARMSMEMGGKTILDYDSTKKSAESDKNPVAGIFGNVVGSKIQYFLDVSNNVERIEGVDEMMNRVSAGASPAEVAPLKSIYTEGYFKQMMSSSRYLPPKPVAPGDTWPVQLEFPMGAMGTFELDYTFTFERWETHGKRNCARLEFQGTMKTKSGSAATAPGLTMNIRNGSTSGVSWFDPELGIIIESQMNQDMTINMTIPQNPRAKSGAAAQPQHLTTQMSQAINIKLDSVK